MIQNSTEFAVTKSEKMPDNMRSDASSDFCRLKIVFLISLTKTYVVGTQKNRLNEMVLLSTHNTC